MDTAQRTKAILLEAEKALAILASEAAKETEYEAASCLIDSAREVNSVAARTLQRLGHSAEKAPGTVGTNKSIALALRSPTRGKLNKNCYPKFLRQGDELVKIGWSPSEKAEYEHRSPRKVLVLLAAAIGKAGANGKRFAMDRVMPLVDLSNERRVPDYQVYLCLAWFRQLGFVKQHGRQGYSVASKAPIEFLLESNWGNLPVR
jgi:hypothetical protein